MMSIRLLPKQAVTPRRRHARLGEQVGSGDQARPRGRAGGRREIDRSCSRSSSVGSLGYIGSLGLCAWAFATEHFAVVPACIFAFFAGMMVLQLVWVLALVPETKGVPLEALARRLQA